VGHIDELVKEIKSLEKDKMATNAIVDQLKIELENSKQSESNMKQKYFELKNKSSNDATDKGIAGGGQESKGRVRCESGAPLYVGRRVSNPELAPSCKITMGARVNKNNSAS